MTKHGIVGLSKSLHAEAAPSNIGVSVLCPGIIDTPLLDGGKSGRSYASSERIQEMSNMFKGMNPDDFASKAMDAVAKNKAIIVIPSWWKILWMMGRLFPTFEINMTSKNWVNISRMLYEED